MDTAQFQLHADIELRHWWFVGRRRIVGRLVEELVSASSAATIIDVGCGTGANLAALSDRYRTIGIDASTEAIALARKRFPGIDFRTGFAPADLGSAMAEAKLVLLMDVLEHVDDDFAMLSRLLAAASPGCHFLVTVPADQGLWSEHDASFGHLRRYDKTQFEQLWTGLPVTPRLVSYYNSRLLPAVRFVRGRNRRRGRAAGRGGTDFWIPAAPINALLTRIFAGEQRRLLQLLAGRRTDGYAAGASLIAVLRREEGEIDVRPREH